MDRQSEQHGLSHRHRFEGPFYRRLMLGGIKHIPPWLKRLTMPFWASIFYLVLPQARRAVMRNLDQVLGPAPLSTRLWRCFQLFWNYAQMLSDTYAGHIGLPIDVEVVSLGRDNVLAAVEKRCGVLAVTGHMGMWQLAPFLAEFRGLPMFYQAMAQEPNPMVQEFEQRFRERFRIIYTNESPFSVLKLAQVLREGAVVGLQIDRRLGGQPTIELPFCGRTAWFPMGPALLARATGAPMVPSFFMVETGKRGPRRVFHHLEPPIEVEHTRNRDADITKAMTKLVAVYEHFVKLYPTQWYQFYDFFAPPEPGVATDPAGSPEPARLDAAAERPTT